MEQQQLVEKITHLETQLKQLENFQFGIRNTCAIAGFFSGKIARYREQMSKEETVFDNPISA
ncbi:hypothetical protein RM549_06090 [Salegentibacter sp. F188]|uniref:Uncharacterized protein n=1 Tax=Autumnicola patrickiae TaxID=3075591 RepID=A0ABU3E045_9FLAO|nr:hypothetical protein [Salegentibacter sp. F188]MDT0689347.1 hypothetical protein [Salegentibacter sp. F188]